MPGIRLLIPAAALAVSTALFAGCGDDDGDASENGSAGPASAAPRELAGDWSGRLTQQGLQPFRVALRIDPDGPTTVAYTGIDCGGRWRWGAVQESEPPTYLIEERIDQGAGGECKGSGEVRLRPRHGSAEPESLDYEFHGGGVTSRGVLRPAEAAEMQRVFGRAGVELPG